MRKFILGMSISFLPLTLIAQEIPLQGRFTDEIFKESKNSNSGSLNERSDESCDGFPSDLPSTIKSGSPWRDPITTQLPLRIMFLEKNAQTQAAQSMVLADAFVKNLNAETIIEGEQVILFKKASTAFGDVPKVSELFDLNKLTQKYGHDNFLTVLVVKDLKTITKQMHLIGYSHKFRAPWQKGVVVVDKDYFKKEANQFLVGKHVIYSYLGVPPIKFDNYGDKGVLEYKNLSLTNKTGDVDFKVFIPKLKNTNEKVIVKCDLNWDTRTIKRANYLSGVIYPLFVPNSDSAFNPMYYRILRSYKHSFLLAN